MIKHTAPARRLLVLAPLSLSWLLSACGAPVAPTSTTPFEAAPQRQLQATSAPAVTASAVAGTFVAARAVDGDSATEWQAPGNPGPSLTLDLRAVVAFSGVSLKVKPGQAFDVQVSDDGVSFRRVLASVTTSTWGLEAKPMPANTTGRYLRLAFAATSSNVMVFEVQPRTTSVSPTGITAPTAAPVTPAPTLAPTSLPPVSAPTGSGFGTRFGNQSVPRSADGSLTRGYQLLGELGMSSIREGWNWQNIEPGDHQYVSWMSYFDDKATQLAARGLKVQAMVCDTPDWASTNGTKFGVPKGLSQPIFADGTDVYKPGVGPNPTNAFAGYMFDMSKRFAGKVTDWQIWNEPDYPSADLGAGTVGSNGNARYWDGSVQDYVRLLKVASTIVKGNDPAAKITLGGLGYESYLAAILDNGGASYFDVVDFHAYGTDKTSSNGVLNSAWGFLGRYNALKQVMTARGVSKSFSCSETGFTADNAAEQASYVPKVFSTGLGLGDVEMVQWAVFTNPGSSNIGLIDGATLTQKTAGYHAFTVATQQLAGCTRVGALSGSGVQGYRFRRPDGQSLLVAWSTTASATLSLPIKASQVLDVQGASQPVPVGSVGLTAAPLYIIGS